MLVIDIGDAVVITAPAVFVAAKHTPVVPAVNVLWAPQNKLVDPEVPRVKLVAVAIVVVIL